MPPITLKAKAAIIDNNTLQSPVYITINNGLIENISPFAPKASAALIDLSHLYLFPGFTNAHCHLELTSIGPLGSHDFLPWIHELLSKKRQQTAVEKTRGVQDGVSQLIRSGVTTVVDHVSFDTPVTVFDNLPIKAVAFGEILGLKEEAALATMAELMVGQMEASVPFYLSPHAVHSVAPQALMQVIPRQRPRSMHISESRDEMDFMLKSEGPFVELFQARYPDLTGSPHPRLTPLACLDTVGFNLDHSLIVHGNYLDATDFEILKKSKNICLVHCPGSHAFFGHDKNPIADAKKYGIPLALGTDSLTSNTDLNLLHEIKLFLNKNAATNWRELLGMITTNACAVLGLSNVGKISEGFQADIVGFTSKASDPIDVLTTAQQADFVMSQGRILL